MREVYYNQNLYRKFNKINENWKNWKNTISKKTEN